MTSSQKMMKDETKKESSCCRRRRQQRIEHLRHRDPTKRSFVVGEGRGMWWTHVVVMLFLFLCVLLSLDDCGCHAVVAERVGPRGAPRLLHRREMVESVFVVEFADEEDEDKEEDITYDHYAYNDKNKDATRPAPTLIPTPRVTSVAPSSILAAAITTATQNSSQVPLVALQPSTTTSTEEEFQQESDNYDKDGRQATTPTSAPFTIPNIPLPPINFPPTSTGNATESPASSPSPSTLTPTVTTSPPSVTPPPVSTTIPPTPGLGQPPTGTPTSIPIILPPIPTSIPTILPTTGAPVNNTLAPTTVAPTTVAPTTATPSATPISTTLTPSAPPTVVEELDLVNYTLPNVQVLFEQVDLISATDIQRLGPIMEEWFNDYFQSDPQNDENNNNNNNSTSTTMPSQRKLFTTRTMLRGTFGQEQRVPNNNNRRRQLQQEILVSNLESKITILTQNSQGGNTTVKYQQYLKYNTPASTGLEPRQVAKLPFQNEDANLNLVGQLREKLISFADLKYPIGIPLVLGSEPTVSPIPPDDNDNDNDDGLSTEAIIGIAVAALLLVGGVYYYSKKSRPLPSERPVENVTTMNASSSSPMNIPSERKNNSLTTSNVEKMEAVESSSEMVGKDTASYAEKSMDTGEFEYANVAAQSAKESEPDGSSGDRGEDATSKGDYSLDSDLQIDEDQYVIYAPAGRLGLVVDNPDDGAPVIHAIKDDSVLKDQVHVGDRLVGVDEVDVRSLSPVKVSKLISKRSTNPLRKLTLTRSKTMGADVDQKSEQGSHAEQDTTVDEEDVQNALGMETDSHTDAHTGMSQSDVDLGLDFPEEGSSVVDSMSETAEIDEQDGDAPGAKISEPSFLLGDVKDPDS